MAKGPSYCVPFRRRREGKTDYKARRALVTSGIPRVVVRPSLKHINVQVIEANPLGDRVLASAYSKELKNYGWKGSYGNIPSAYLTGYLCGLRATAKKIEKTFSDIGLHQPTKGARVFAAINGVIDAGIHVPHSVEKLPDAERLEGKHVAEYARSVAASDMELYKKVFSRYLKGKILPEKLNDYFTAVKGKIDASYAPKTSTKRHARRKKIEKPVQEGKRKPTKVNSE